MSISQNCATCRDCNEKPEHTQCADCFAQAKPGNHYPLWTEKQKPEAKP